MKAPEPGQKTVGDVYEADVDRAKVVDAATPLSEIVDLFEHDRSIEAAIVVDARDKFAGLVQRSDLAGWLNANLAGPRADRLPIEQLGDELGRADASEACGPGSHRAAVREDEPVDHALRELMGGPRSVLAVVDREGRVQGDVRLTRLLTALTR